MQLKFGNEIYYSGYWNGQCIIDSTSRVFPDPHLDLTKDNTPSECIKRCIDRDKGYVFAGVQFGSQCFCGHVAPPSDLIVEESQCKKKCSGDGNLICGGSWRMNVYEIGK